MEEEVKMKYQLQVDDILPKIAVMYIELPQCHYSNAEDQVPAACIIRITVKLLPKWSILSKGRFG